MTYIHKVALEISSNLDDTCIIGGWKKRQITCTVACVSVSDMCVVCRLNVIECELGALGFTCIYGESWLTMMHRPSSPSRCPLLYTYVLFIWDIHVLGQVSFHYASV